MHRLQSVYKWRCFPNDTLSKLPSIRICSHITLEGNDYYLGCVKDRRCRKCRTEYRIDSKYYEGYGEAIFLTRWKDLGPGPDDEVWRQHLPPSIADIVARLFFSQLKSHITPKQRSSYKMTRYPLLSAMAMISSSTPCCHTVRGLRYFDVGGSACDHAALRADSLLMILEVRHLEGKLDNGCLMQAMM